MNEIIGLVGGMCSGKDTWADYFADRHGFRRVTTSDVVRTYIRENDLGEPTRDLTRETATMLRARYGAEYLAASALQHCGVAKRMVVSGLYVPDEAALLKSGGGLIVKINIQPEIQVARMQQRARAGEGGGIEEFSRLAGNDLNSRDTDQRLADVLAMADMEIDGSVPMSDRESIHLIAEEVLASLRRARKV